MKKNIYRGLAILMSCLPNFVYSQQSNVMVDFAKDIVNQSVWNLKNQRRIHTKTGDLNISYFVDHSPYANYGDEDCVAYVEFTGPIKNRGAITTSQPSMAFVDCGLDLLNSNKDFYFELDDLSDDPVVVNTPRGQISYLDSVRIDANASEIRFQYGQTYLDELNEQIEYFVAKLK